MPAFGAAEPIPASRRLAREAADHLSGLASGVSDSLAEWRRQQDVAEYQGLPEWQKPLVAATDAAEIFADGVTLGFGNQLAAALATLTTDETYSQLLAKIGRPPRGAYNRAGPSGDVLGLLGGIRSKKVVNAAKRIRERINVNTDINDVLQFNSLLGTGLGAGFGAGAPSVGKRTAATRSCRSAGACFSSMRKLVS